MRQLARAVHLLSRHASLWPTAVAPLGLSVLGYLIVLAGGFWLVVPWLSDLGERVHVPVALGWFIGSALYGLVWLVLSGPVYLLFFGLLSIPSWERLSRQVEEIEFGSHPKRSLPIASLVLDAAGRIALAMAALTFLAVMSWVGLGLVAAPFAGLAILYDLTAPSCLRRGCSLLCQHRLVLSSPAGWFLWIAVSLLSLVPVLNLVLLPAFVVAGTLVVAENESKARFGRPVPVE